MTYKIYVTKSENGHRLTNSEIQTVSSYVIQTNDINLNFLKRLLS